MERAARFAFGGIARLRGDRAFHPDGVVLAGTFRATGAGTGAPLFDDGREDRDAVVRLSRGAGLPQPAPDVLGCAIRVPDAYGAGRHQDLALASSGRRPVLRHALFPVRDFASCFYSSVLPYEVGGAARMLGAAIDGGSDRTYRTLDDLRARMATGEELTAQILVATPLGAWHEVASVRLDALITDARRRIRFNPWNAGPGIRPRGRLNALRDPAYRASQEAAPGRD